MRVPRSFVFVDLSGFTNYTAAFGDDAAGRLLGAFRALTREVASETGVRIAKWLGDGVMLVSTDPGPMVATVSELLARLSDGPLPVRAGVASGECLLFEGDDYIGRPVNLAARLSDQARPGQILADGDVALMAPGWVEVVDRGTRRIKGFGKVRDVREVRMAPGVRLPDPD